VRLAEPSMEDIFLHALSDAGVGHG
jgi:hypothetical protein